MAYQFRDGFRARGVTAEIAHAEMERLRAEKPLTAKRLFEAARPKTAPLHAEFVWDGKAAIEELGLLRARTLLRAVLVLDEEVPAEPPRHVYVHVPDEQTGQVEGAYVPLDVIIQEPDAYARALGELGRKFSGAESALKELQAVARQSAAPDRLAAITMASEAFAAARQALALLAA